MNITINGDVYITNYGQTLDELTKDTSFDDETYYDDHCDDCGICEDEEYFSSSKDPLVDLIDEYAEFLTTEETCFDCARSILENFIYELIHGLD